MISKLFYEVPKKWKYIQTKFSHLYTKIPNREPSVRPQVMCALLYLLVAFLRPCLRLGRLPLEAGSRPAILTVSRNLWLRPEPWWRTCDSCLIGSCSEHSQSVPSVNIQLIDHSGVCQSKIKLSIEPELRPLHHLKHDRTRNTPSKPW